MTALVTFSCDTSVRFSTSSDITLSGVDVVTVGSNMLKCKMWVDYRGSLSTVYNDEVFLQS